MILFKNNYFAYFCLVLIKNNDKLLNYIFDSIFNLKSIVRKIVL